jgi:hypothetical protein
MIKNCLLVSLIALALMSFKPEENMERMTNLKLEDSTLFNFWVGDWEASWNENGTVKLLGENHLSKEFNGWVIREKFKVNDGTSKGFEGGSWTVYDKQKQKWFQTWVDNQGAYMAFEGKLEGDKRIFERSTIDKKGKPIIQRMVFKDISADSFTWDWESSADNGKTWTLNWQILYKRKK